MYNLIFFGSDQYSATALSIIIESKKLAQISIITDRPKPKDRTQSIEQNSVEKLAKTHNLNVAYYPTNDTEMISLADLLKIWIVKENTIGLCASFDHLLPSNIIDLFSGNLYNLHPSLLPQYRNVSPVQYAIALGDKETGITLFRISSGIDNGEIIAQSIEKIDNADTTSSLTPRLFEKGAELLIDYLQHENVKEFTAHDEPLIFTKRLTRESGFIEWEIIQKLLNNLTIATGETTNLLLSLRLSRTQSTSGLNILNDLSRALSPWPTVWTNVPTKKGELRVTFESILPDIKVKIAGKPKAISYSDFTKYYF